MNTLHKTLILASLITVLIGSTAYSQSNDTISERPVYLPNKTIDRYSLILFNFNSNEAGSLNQKILQTYVVDDIQPGARISVMGYTDVVGLEDRNKRLSEQRAAIVDTTLKNSSAWEDIASLETKGVGETQPLYSNDLPEGRFYNRTVQVVIETPIQSD